MRGYAKVLANGIEIEVRGFCVQLYETEARDLMNEIGNALEHLEIQRGREKVLPSVGGVTVYVDGGCRGNGSETAKAYGSYQIGGYAVQRLNLSGSHTNNEAEYAALSAALRAVKDIGLIGVAVKMDSQLVVNQVNGEWKVREPSLMSLRDEAAKLLKEVQGTLRWVRRDVIVEKLGH